MGIPAAWLVCGGSGIDSITLFAAAAMRTQRILFGTAIVQTFPRHPVLMAQQAQVLAQLAPGRFRLGIGTGHRPNMEATFGADFRAPLSHLSEYIHILKSVLHEGAIEFNGRFYKANVRIASPVDVPVMASALQPKSFELCGAEADGAISWVCPMEYLRDVALPAMKAGAERAGRPVPPLINGIPVCVHDNPEEVRAAVREQPSGSKLQRGHPRLAENLLSAYVRGCRVAGSLQRGVERCHDRCQCAVGQRVSGGGEPAWASVHRGDRGAGVSHTCRR